MVGVELAAEAAVEDECGQCFNVIKRSINNFIEKYDLSCSGFILIAMLLFGWWGTVTVSICFAASSFMGEPGSVCLKPSEWSI